MNVVIFYDLQPEEVLFYHIKDAPDWLLKCHGYVFNSHEIPSDVVPLLERLSDYISPPRYAQYAYNKEDENNCCWHDCQIKLEELNKIKMDENTTMIWTGCWQ